MRTFNFWGFVLFTTLLCLSACSSGSDNPIEPTPKPEIVKSEITIDSSLISNGLSFTNAGGDQSISFTTNENWTLNIANTTSGATWCTASTSSGTKGSTSVKFTVTENTTYDNRSVSVTIKAGTASKTFTISQKGVDALLVTTNKYEVSQEGGTIDIEVKANIDYKMEISEKAKNWIKESSNRALIANKHTLNIELNEEFEKREGEIYFRSGDKVETVKVYQTGGAILLLSQNECNVSDKGDTISVDIKSNIDFGVQMPDVDWIIDEASSRGLSSHTLKYIISANKEYDGRSASIVFYDKNSDLKDTLNVVQAQKDAIILSQKEKIVSCDGETIEVKLYSNVEYELTMPKVDWITQVESRSLVEHCLYFKIDKNENDVERNVEILFNCKNSNWGDTLKIKQNKFVKGLYLPSGETFNVILRDYYLKEKINKTKLKFISNSPKTSKSEFYVDNNGMKAFLVINGEWVEVHTTANEFIAHKDCSNMFHSITFTAIDFGDGFNTTNVEDMSYMFHNRQSLKTLNIDVFDTSNVINMRAMFGQCRNLEELNVSHFDVSNVEDMAYMFQSCEKLESLDVSNFNTENVIDMSYTFSLCYELKEIDLSRWNTSKVENMEGLFWEYKFDKLDLSSFNTDNVINMRAMFSSCSNLSVLNVANFNTSKVENMECMFHGCSSLSELDLSGFNTISVQDMYGMFEDCSSLSKLDISNFDTSNVTNMWGMFNNCSALIELDLSNFNTVNVKNMEAMFKNCSSLTELDLSCFKTDNVESMYEMFYSCTKLKMLNINKFNTINISARYSFYRIFGNLPSMELLDLGKSFVINYNYYASIDDKFGNKDGVKIICCKKTMEVLKESCRIYNSPPITWINAETNEDF